MTSRWLLRRPARVGYGPGAHDTVREYRVLCALGADPTMTDGPQGIGF